jgi:hypothetical protein
VPASNYHLLWLPQGLDISPAMLEVASDREVEGDLCLHDLGHGLPIRPGSIDGAISISAVQWLCNAVSGTSTRAGRQGVLCCAVLCKLQQVPAGGVLWVRRQPSKIPTCHSLSYIPTFSPTLISLIPHPHLQDTSANEPRRRLRRFFESLYACLSKGARAVLQVYPANTDQAAMMTNAAMRAGFSGGLVVDFPHRCLVWCVGWMGVMR